LTIQGQRVVGRGSGSGFGLVEIDAPPLAAMFLGPLAAGAFDQDAAHVGGGEEVAAAVPVLGPLGIHQAQVGLVDNQPRRGSPFSPWERGEGATQ
jgi:hypothetical protein